MRRQSAHQTSAASPIIRVSPGTREVQEVQEVHLPPPPPACPAMQRLTPEEDPRAPRPAHRAGYRVPPGRGGARVRDSQMAGIGTPSPSPGPTGRVPAKRVAGRGVRALGRSLSSSVVTRELPGLPGTREVQEVQEVHRPPPPLVHDCLEHLMPFGDQKAPRPSQWERHCVGCQAAARRKVGLWAR